MPEEVLFKSEKTIDRSTVAEYLRAVADSLDAGGPIKLSSGNQSVSLEPPGRLTFEVKAEREWSKKGGPDQFSIEFELEWKEGDAQSEAGGNLKIG